MGKGGDKQKKNVDNVDKSVYNWILPQNAHLSMGIKMGTMCIKKCGQCGQVKKRT